MGKQETCERNIPLNSVKSYIGESNDQKDKLPVGKILQLSTKGQSPVFYSILPFGVHSI